MLLYGEPNNSRHFSSIFSETRLPSHLIFQCKLDTFSDALRSATRNLVRQLHKKTLFSCSPGISGERTESWIVVRPWRQVMMLFRREQVGGGAPSLHGGRRGLAVGGLRRARPVQLGLRLVAPRRQLRGRRPHQLYTLALTHSP